MPSVVRRLGPHDVAVLEQLADGVFDAPVQPSLTQAFLTDPRHHLFVAIEDGTVVGMISGVDYLHPDKAAQLWINELGVAPPFQRHGLARQLLSAMLDHAAAIGCTAAWLATDVENAAARGLYEQAGSVAEPAVVYSFDLTRSRIE